MVLVRSDFLYFCDVELGRPTPGSIHIPFGEDYGGVTDRFHVFRGADATRAMGQLTWLVTNYTDEATSQLDAGEGGLPMINVENTCLRTFEANGLQIVRFNRTMACVATDEDTTLWMAGHGHVPGYPELKIKYDDEMRLAVDTCARRVG